MATGRRNDPRSGNYGNDGYGGDGRGDGRSANRGNAAQPGDGWSGVPTKHGSVVSGPSTRPTVRLGEEPARFDMPSSRSAGRRQSRSDAGQAGSGARNAGSQTAPDPQAGNASRLARDGRSQGQASARAERAPQGSADGRGRRESRSQNAGYAAYDDAGRRNERPNQQSRQPGRSFAGRQVGNDGWQVDNAGRQAGRGSAGRQPGRGSAGRQAGNAGREAYAPVAYAGVGAAAPARKSRKPLLIVAIIVVVLALAALAYFKVFAAQPQEQAVESEASVTEKTVASAGNKLAGATETTDANGVVHGSVNGVNYTVTGRGTSAQQSDKVTFIGGGDQVIGDWALEIADGNAGTIGDGEYSFDEWYDYTRDFIGQYDLRYIDQETPLAGGEYSGYPVFNTPDSAASALANCGFNLINFANNHTFDMGTAGVERTHEVFSQWASTMLLGGSYLTAEDRETVHMIERNGITFAFLAYTYGDNYYGTDLDNEYRPNKYYNNIMDRDIITADVKRAQQVADVVIVSMHWGDEYVTEPSDFQLDYAQLLVDLDVDLVVGEHAHILQPVYNYTSPTGKTIPVVFGLSDYVSGWTLVECTLSALFTCDFVKDASGAVTVENCAMYPCIEYQGPYDSTVSIRRLADLTDEELNANLRNDNCDDLVSFVDDFFATTRYDVPIIR